MRTPVLLLATLLGLGSGLRSQTPGKGGVQLQGIVRDADTDRPLARISIWDGQKFTATDAEGRFTVAGLSAGRLRLNASGGGGYILDGLSDPKSNQRTVYRQDGVYVTLGADTPTQITLYMRLAPLVTGTVLDSFGQPVFDAMVTAHRLVYDANGNPTLSRQLSGQTDDRGEFESESLPPGDYVFRAEKSRPDTDPRLPFVPARYPAYSDASRPETIAIGRETTRIPPIVLSSAPGAKLQIRVVNATETDPLGYTSMSLSRKEDLSPVLSLLGSLQSGSARLPQGSYIVEVAVREYRNLEASSDVRGAILSRVTVDVRDTDILLPVTLSRGTRVEGRAVKRERNGETNPLSGVQVRLAEDASLSSSLVLGASSGADGTFEFSSVPEGAYRLRVPHYGEDSGPDYVRDQDLLAAPRGVCFSEVRQNDVLVAGNTIRIAGASTAITVVLRDSTTRIQGKVVDSKGQAASSAVVALAPDDRSQSRSFAAMTADQNGDFEFTCAPAGNYRVFAWTELSGAAYRNEEFMARYKDRGTVVRLADGDSLTVQAELIEP